MDFYRFRKIRDVEIPFAGQTIAPAAFRNLRLKPVAHNADDVFWLSIGVKIKIAAEIGPVIKRLDYCDVVALGFEVIADRFQKGKRMCDAR